MTRRPLPAAAIVAAGTAFGVAGDQLLRASGAPGLNFFMLFVGLAVAVWIVARRTEEGLSTESMAWIAVGLACGAALMWRGSELLRFSAFVAACTAFALPAVSVGKAWVRRSGVVDVAEAYVGAGLHAAFGTVRLLVDQAHGSSSEEDAARSTSMKVLRAGVGGLLIAGVPLVVFGALFASADPVFATALGDFVRFDLQAFASHAALIAVLSWLACGYLVGVASGTRLEPLRRLQPSAPRVGLAQVGTAIGLVDLLFFSFVVVQFRTLFGGGAWVEVTPGLTYAAYARAGFFQLVAAVGLAIPWLLATHSLLGDDEPRARTVFRGLAGVHVVLLLVVVASAFQRMAAYQAAYGLTEDRVVVTSVLVALTLVVLWLGATVFSGRRNRFAFGALVIAFVLVGSLQVINPAGLVTKHNLDHMAELGGVDVHYLTAMGSDAVPHLVERLPELAPDEQCIVTRRLMEKWGPDRPADWRAYNAADHRARQAIQAVASSWSALPCDFGDPTVSSR